jgi:serine O-acetyltransferase
VNIDIVALQRRMQRQLDGCVGDGFDAGASIGAALPRALERTRHCISRVRAWSHRGFDPLNSGQYATLLYFVSRELWLSHGDAEGATRLFLLNKALNAMELFHEIELPDVFFHSHTPGLVLAKASYASHLVLHQGCTVGRKAGDARPVIDERVVLLPGSMVIGRCHVRANSVLAPGVCLVDTDTPGDCLVLNGPAGLLIKPARREVWRDYLID